MAFTDIEICRLEIGDNDVVFPILSDEEYEYFIEKNEGSLRRAQLDAAKTILFKLASYTYERVDILEHKGSDYFVQYKQALQMFIKNPEYGSASFAGLYAGGISLQDIQDNMSNIDNNYVKVEKSIPVDGQGYSINNTSPFSESDFSTFSF